MSVSISSCTLKWEIKRTLILETGIKAKLDIVLKFYIGEEDVSDKIDWTKDILIIRLFDYDEEIGYIVRSKYGTKIFFHDYKKNEFVAHRFRIDYKKFKQRVESITDIENGISLLFQIENKDEVESLEYILLDAFKDYNNTDHSPDIFVAARTSDISNDSFGTLHSGIEYTFIHISDLPNFIGFTIQSNTNTAMFIKREWCSIKLLYSNYKMSDLYRTRNLMHSDSINIFIEDKEYITTNIDNDKEWDVEE